MANKYVQGKETKVVYKKERTYSLWIRILALACAVLLAGTVLISIITSIIN